MLLESDTRDPSLAELIATIGRKQEEVRAVFFLKGSQAVTYKIIFGVRGSSTLYLVTLTHKPSEQKFVFSSLTRYERES